MTQKEFYHRGSWKQDSKAYALSKNCICERCGRPVYVAGVTDYIPKEKRLRYIVHHKTYLNDNNVSDDSIAYDWDNLELLCIDCHNDEHPKKRRGATRKGLYFDDFGELRERKIIPR